MFLSGGVSLVAKTAVVLSHIAPGSKVFVFAASNVQLM